MAETNKPAEQEHGEAVERRLTKIKNKSLWLKGQKYGFLSGKPYPDNPKKCVYLVGTIDEETPDFSLSRLNEKTKFLLWNVEFTDEKGNMNLWPYEADNSAAIMKELMEDYLEHAFDDDYDDD